MDDRRKKREDEIRRKVLRLAEISTETGNELVQRILALIEYGPSRRGWSHFDFVLDLYCELSRLDQIGQIPRLVLAKHRLCARRFPSPRRCEDVVSRSMRITGFST